MVLFVGRAASSVHYHNPSPNGRVDVHVSCVGRPNPSSVSCHMHIIGQINSEDRKIKIRPKEQEQVLVGAARRTDPLNLTYPVFLLNLVQQIWK